ncbi:MAG: CDP-glycerol glycerophosphotransferase family protein, partial [Senegalia sp. (in: firmicutes)]
MKKINKFILNQAKRKIRFIYIPLKDRMKKTQIKKAAKYAYLYKKNKVNSNCILYQSRDGKSLTDNPYAVFLYLLNNENYKHMQHVWVVDSKQKKKYYENEYSEFKNISFIIKESDQYLDYLTKAKYVLNNSTFPSYFTKKEDQVYVNTWHGTPIKNMGLDVEDSLLSSQNIIKNFLSSDILVSPNTHTTDIFKRAYKLDGLYNGNLLEIGYPRIDLTINSNKSNVIQHLSKNKIEVENKKVLLFAPTWRGKNMNKPEDDIESILETVKELKKNTDYQVLVKVHPFTYQTALKYEQLKEFLVPDTFVTNVLLGIIDLFVTVYACFFFVYLVWGLGVVFVCGVFVVFVFLFYHTPQNYSPARRPPTKPPPPPPRFWGAWVGRPPPPPP